MKDFNIPLLTAEDIDCRVQSVSKAKNGTVGAVLLLYKDARTPVSICESWTRSSGLVTGREPTN